MRATNCGICPDVAISIEGSIASFYLLSSRASDWVDAHTIGERQFFGGALVVEHRYVADLVAGMRQDGLWVHVVRQEVA